MNIAVRYYTKTGNSRKLAQAIAQALGVEAQDVSVPLDSRADALFLCNAVYAAGVDGTIRQFIRDNKSNIGTLYNVSTAALLPSTYKQVQKIAQENGVTLAKEEFHCHGAFALVHKGRPNENDLKAAADFARRITL